MRNEINLADADIEDRFDDIGYSVSVSDLVFSRDTIADFRAARGDWNEPGRVDLDGDDLLVIQDAQSARGQPRRDVVVVDFGTVRAIYA